MELKMNRYLTLKNIPMHNKYGFDFPKDSFQSIKRQGTSSPVCLVYLNGRIIIADQFHENDGSMATLMQILVFCNGNTSEDKSHRKPDLEKALLDFAASKGFHKKLFEKIVPKIAEVRIDGEPEKVAAIIGLNGRYRMVVKDKPERLLGRCNRFLFKGKTVPLTMNMIARVKNIYQQMTSDNLHVIMLAFKDMERLPLKLDPVFQTDGLTLVGMIGWQDSVPDNPEAEIGESI